VSRRSGRLRDARGGTTGGGTTAPTTVRTQAELRTCATATGPRVCRVQGTLTFNPFEEIRVASDKTIIGAGTNAEIVMGGFFLASGIHNVIIRNLTIRDSYIEGSTTTAATTAAIATASRWTPPTTSGSITCTSSHLGDGMIDSRKDTTYLTVSWNILENHNKAFGIGWTDNVTAQMTIHHNWIHDTTQRNPSTDNVLRAHLFNNLLENCTSYGNYARGATNMVLQNSTFVRRQRPALLRHRHAGGDGQRLSHTTGHARVDGDDVLVLRSGHVLQLHAGRGGRRRGERAALRRARAPSSETERVSARGLTLS
jgi:pectate lyase